MITATALKFFVPGRPAPQGSKRHVGRGVLIESSKELQPWRERVALAAHNAMHAAGTTLFTTAVTVNLEFVMRRPLSTPKSYTPHATRQPDLDKLQRAILDAITGTVLADDALVVEIHARKRLAAHAEAPGVAITVDTLPPPARGLP